MQHHAPTGVRRYGRPRAVTLFALGIVVSGTVASASTPSATTAAQIRLVSASVPLDQATHEIPSRYAFSAEVRATSLANRTAQVTTTAVWSDKSSVRSGGTVHLTGQVTYGARPWQVAAQPVFLQVKSGTAWRDVAALTTSANGAVGFTVKPTRSSTYRVSYRGRLNYQGSGGLTASASAPSTVTVTSPSASSSSAPKASSVTTASYAPAVAATGRAAQVVAAAAAQTGKPYQYGAAGPNSFDCSGLTMYAFKTVGINLPHNADAQKSYGTAVSRANARPGDLIIFLSGGHGYHAAIYAGGGYMYDAPNAGTTVGKHQIYSGTVIFRRLV